MVYGITFFDIQQKTGTEPPVPVSKTILKTYEKRLMGTKGTGIIKTGTVIRS